MLLERREVPRRVNDIVRGFLSSLSNQSLEIIPENDHTVRSVGNDAGEVVGVETVQIDWSKPGEKAPFSEVPGSEQLWPAELVLLALGFLDLQKNSQFLLGNSLCTLLIQSLEIR